MLNNFWADDQIRYTIDGKEHVGLVHEVREVTILVQPISIDFEYNREGRFEKQVLNVADVEDMDMHILDDHWGCDNSAIGVAPCYEPYNDFSWRKDV